MRPLASFPGTQAFSRYISSGFLEDCPAPLQPPGTPAKVRPSPAAGDQMYLPTGVQGPRPLPLAPLSWQGCKAPACAAPRAVNVRGRDRPASWGSSHPLEPDPDAASASVFLGDAGQDEGARLLLHEGPGANGQLPQVRPRGAHIPAHPQVGLPTRVLRAPVTCRGGFCLCCCP